MSCKPPGYAEFYGTDTIAAMSADPADPDFDLTKEFDRLIKEGEARQATKEVEKVTLEPRYDCTKNFHKWKWYNGFTDRFYHCELCPVKDRKRPPPPSRS